MQTGEASRTVRELQSDKCALSLILKLKKLQMHCNTRIFSTISEATGSLGLHETFSHGMANDAAHDACQAVLSKLDDQAE